MQPLEILKIDNKRQFYIILTLAILSWLIPDFLPFIDEVVLAYLVLMKFREL